MSRICEGCGKRPETGHNVSYSQRKTNRRFLPNLFTKRIWFAPKKIFLTIKMCTRCLRTLNKKI